MSSEQEGSESSDDTGVVDELIASGARVGELIELLVENPNTTIRGQVEELIQSFDVLHREAMVRIAGLLAKQHLLEQAIEDPVLSFIFDLYELTPEQIMAAQKREEAVAAGGLVKLGDIRHFKAEPVSDAGTDEPKRSATE
ncbi:MAG: hypothetical protein ACREN2_11830 [Candidatus Dormibacteria bacterium]